MKKLFLIIIVLFAISTIIQAQNPCYIKFTYDASGNRIKREFICAPVDSIINLPNGGGGGNARLTSAQSQSAVNTSATAFDFNVLPNPTNGKVQIVATNNTEILNGIIYNSIGQEIINFELGMAPQNFDLTNLSAGIYYAVLQSHTQKVTKKFVKTE
jgi:hypothetical protein